MMSFSEHRGVLDPLITLTKPCGKVALMCFFIIIIQNIYNKHFQKYIFIILRTSASDLFPLNIHTKTLLPIIFISDV